MSFTRNCMATNIEFHPGVAADIKEYKIAKIKFTALRTIVL